MIYVASLQASKPCMAGTLATYERDRLPILIMRSNLSKH
jgi:hypothetical protein